MKCVCTLDPRSRAKSRSDMEDLVCNCNFLKLTINLWIYLLCFRWRLLTSRKRLSGKKKLNLLSIRYLLQTDIVGIFRCLLAFFKSLLGLKRLCMVMPYNFCTLWSCAWMHFFIDVMGCLLAFVLNLISWGTFWHIWRCLVIWTTYHVFGYALISSTDDFYNVKHQESLDVTGNKYVSFEYKSGMDSGRNASSSDQESQ